MSQSDAYDPYAMTSEAITEPPRSLWAALRKIGPGIILAGSIIGTGELLLTTGLGAKYGFAFLWLILLSCVIKVFVQIELGRYAISSGKPTLSAIDELPGPRLGAHWLVWWWFIMLLATVSQLGAMVGGVGQALHLAFPGLAHWLTAQSQDACPSVAETLSKHQEYPWSVLTALAAVLLLLSGSYRRIERLTTVMVALVTLITVVCVAALPATGYPVRMSDLAEGFTFVLPAAGIAAAFGAFGITGVGASELYSYPYWCLEKGYARFAGPRTDDAEWVRRAQGWIRVMNLDAWVSMLVFTVATVSFYFMGATILHRQGLHPEGTDMMAQLSQMYVPAFGKWTTAVFLVGAWAVLFKTLYVASASHSRLTSDFISLVGLVKYSAAGDRNRWIRRFCIFYPALSLVLFLCFGDPRTMVVFGGFAQGLTLPLLAALALFFRYRRTDPRLAPSRVWDACLWIALAAISAVAAYAVPDTVVNKVWPLIESWLQKL